MLDAAKSVKASKGSKGKTHSLISKHEASVNET